MAKLGETDPRWIVENREDWANVNNWHWTERDMSDWAFEKIKFLLTDSKCDQNNQVWCVTQVDIDGLATINVRKGSLKTIYDFEIKLKFDMKLESEVISGEIQIPEFSFDTSSGDVTYNVQMDTKSIPAEGVYKIVKDTCAYHIRPKLDEFLKIFNDYCVSIKLPKTPDSPNVVKSESITQDAIVAKPSTKSEGTTSVELEQSFDCSCSFLFNIFTDSDKIEAFTSSEAKFEAKVGAEYSFLNSNISGKVILCILNEKLILSWRFKDWPEKCFSRVTLTFHPSNHGTKLVVLHEEIPVNELERVSSGWPRYFFKPIQSVFGIGTGDLPMNLF